MRWAIDAGDPRSIVAARRALAHEIRRRAYNPDEVFAAEVLIGEILSAEMDRGRVAIAVELEWANDCPVVHLYDQGDPFGVHAQQNDLRRALIESFGEYLDVATSDQGNHLSFAVPIDVTPAFDTEHANPRLWRLASELVARRSRFITEQLQQSCEHAFPAAATDDALS